LLVGTHASADVVLVDPAPISARAGGSTRVASSSSATIAAEDRRRIRSDLHIRA
jgi:hypothetical protein